MRALAILFSLLLFSLPAGAEESHFEQGLKAYQSKNWDAARDQFEQALQNHPQEAAIFYNLGLTYFQLGKRGYAVAYWRKALGAAPGLGAAAMALDQMDEKYHFSRLDRSPWASAAHDIFSRFDWNLWLLALAISLSLTGTIWLKFFERRKAALSSDSLETPSAGWSHLLLTLLFVAILGGNLGKFFDERNQRGTVVSTTAEIKSAPSKDGVTLTPVAEGAEVAIVRDHGDWVQVFTGDGSTGWMAKSDLLVVGRNNRW